MNTIKSEFLKLNSNDFVKALFMAVASPVVAYLIQVGQVYVAGGGSLAIDWKYLAGVAFSAGLAYLVKQFGTNSQGNLGTEPVSTVGQSATAPTNTTVGQ